LTNDPAKDFSPAWSPDGRFIAFLRQVAADKDVLVLVPQRGGQERILAENNVRGDVYGPFLSWTPDSKWLVCPALERGQRVLALNLFSTETGEQRKLTNPPPEEVGDTAPALSPDGRTLVFSRVSPDMYNVSPWLLRLGEGYKPSGKEEKVQLSNMTNFGAAWLPDGSEFVFGSAAGTNLSNFSLWRMAASKNAIPRRLDLGASNDYSPTISRQGNRLAFVTGRGDSNIWRIDLRGPDKKPSTPKQFISSTQSELDPEYSPDGRKIAFMSDRSGTQEIWVCDSDGSNAVQLTSLGGYALYGPSWSGDGQHIAFTAVRKGMKEDVYVISAKGGVPRRLTTHPAEDKWPYWSHDGKWIYFASTRTGREEIWRMSSDGGEAVQITQNSGDTPQESPDGKFVYYAKGWPDTVSVWRVSVEGGQEAKILDSVHSEGKWSVVKEGIYFFRPPDREEHSDLSFYDIATGQTTKIVTVERPVYTHMAVSPDSRTIIYPQFDELGSDLMLVENFH